MTNYIITSGELERANLAVKTYDWETDGEHPGIVAKPFPTCETCDKWKTKKCIISRLCEDMLRNSNRDISKGIYPDHDFCCINHQDFRTDETAKADTATSEVTNGK